MHLGTSMYTLGSVLWLLVYEVLDETPAANMHRVWVDIVKHYKEDNVSNQYSNLGLGSFCNPDNPKEGYPKLKGRRAEVAHLVEPLCKTWGSFKRAGNECDQKVHQLLKVQIQIQAKHFLSFWTFFGEGFSSLLYKIDLSIWISLPGHFAQSFW